MLLAIPTDREGLSKHIVNACRELKVDHAVFDIYASDWMAALHRLKPAGCVYIAEFRYSSWRELFGERIRFVNQQMGIPIYPRLHELELWESKRRMAYWLEYHQVPHPRTWIFGKRQQALDFIQSATYPLIFKTDFGNAASGVRLLQNKSQALSIFRRSFGNGYRVPTYREFTLDLVPRLKALIRPAYRKLSGIRHLPRDVELDVMLFQELVPIKHEWRLIKAGDSFFGNQKVRGKHGFHSGSSKSSWSIPPAAAFDLVKRVCEIGDFATMGLDVFETDGGELQVNELQTIFGVIANNQMYREKNGQLVGFRKYFDANSGQWCEEEGEFGQDYCYRLRVKDFVSNLIK